LFYKLEAEHSTPVKGARAKINVGPAGSGSKQGREHGEPYVELHNASSRSSFRQEPPAKQSPAKQSKRPAFDLDNTGQDLELEGGRPDQPENSQTFHKNTILEPFDFASVQVSITERRLE